jgi:NADH-quinone oxidoreductase subunit A
MFDYFLILVFTGAAAAMVGAVLLIARVIAPRSWSRTKGTPYECGVGTIGPTWIRFNVGYYLFALLFLVFDVEAAFLYPWALVFREVGLAGLIEVGIFVLVLIVGLAYAWRKGALEWV